MLSNATSLCAAATQGAPPGAKVVQVSLQGTAFGSLAASLAPSIRTFFQPGHKRPAADGVDRADGPKRRSPGYNHGLEASDNDDEDDIDEADVPGGSNRSSQQRLAFAGCSTGAGKQAGPDAGWQSQRGGAWSSAGQDSKAAARSLIQQQSMHHPSDQHLPAKSCLNVQGQNGACHQSQWPKSLTAEQASAKRSKNDQIATGMPLAAQQAALDGSLHQIQPQNCGRPAGAKMSRDSAQLPAAGKQLTISAMFRKK